MTTQHVHVKRTMRENAVSHRSYTYYLISYLATRSTGVSREHHLHRDDHRPKLRYQPCLQ